MQAVLDDQHRVVVVQRRKGRDELHALQGGLLALVAMLDHHRPGFGATVNDTMSNERDPALAALTNHIVTGDALQDLCEHGLVRRAAVNGDVIAGGHLVACGAVMRGELERRLGALASVHR